MYTVTLNNSGGELDTKTAATPEQAAEIAIKMIQDAGLLYPGDTIKIEGDE